MDALSLIARLREFAVTVKMTAAGPVLEVTDPDIKPLVEDLMPLIREHREAVIAALSPEALEELSWECCPTCWAWTHPHDAARLCNALTRPRAVLSVASDGTMTSKTIRQCHYETRRRSGGS